MTLPQPRDGTDCLRLVSPLLRRATNARQAEVARQNAALSLMCADLETVQARRRAPLFFLLFSHVGPLYAACTYRVDGPQTVM